MADNKFTLFTIYLYFKDYFDINLFEFEFILRVSFIAFSNLVLGC